MVGQTIHLEDTAICPDHVSLAKKMGFTLIKMKSSRARLLWSSSTSLHLMMEDQDLNKSEQKAVLPIKSTGSAESSNNETAEAAPKNLAMKLHRALI